MRPNCEALIVIDVQNDFCPGGALAVPGGDQVIGQINAMMDEYTCVVLTQDWHPADHASFADNHPGAAPYDTIEMGYGTQVLWPRHCVQGSRGAAFHTDLRTDPAQLIIRKGFRSEVDSYSAFFENDKTTPTGLEGFLRSRGIRSLTIVGLAEDFCVAYSASDAAQLGFNVTLLQSACRAIDLNGSLAQSRKDLLARGVTLAP